ncbi:MAG: DUF1566 domain-containing protein [Nitrospirae bacterium]|nr:DUF1566 domain-containing protein [Nitrospirota bacterium]
MFETAKEFTQRLAGHPPVLAGDAELLRNKYDIKTGVFPLTIQWHDWIKPILSSLDLPTHIVAERDTAKELYASGSSHPVYVRLQAGGRGAEISEIALSALGKSWKVVSEKSPTQSSTRFIDNGNGTVTDAKTGLCWLKDANCIGRLNWGDAIAACQRLAGGQCGLTDGSKAGDWRLPTRDELKQLVTDVLNCFLRPDPPFVRVQSSNYWASSTYASSAGNAWYVNLGDGVVFAVGKTGSNYVWPVRGGE